MIASTTSRLLAQPRPAAAGAPRSPRPPLPAAALRSPVPRFVAPIPAALTPAVRPAGRAGARAVAVRARWSGGGGGGGGGADIANRVLGAVPYLLPLFDGLRYGKFLFAQAPIFATLLAPFDPLIRVYFSVPFASIACFFAVYLGIINNQSLPRTTRFNAMQAVLLDIILILPGLIESVIKIQPGGGAGLQIYITIYNTIFLFLFACVGYGVAASLAGQTARLPLVAEAADAQIR